MRRVRWLAMVVPVLGLILWGVFSHYVMSDFVNSGYGWIVETAVLVVLAIVFSLIVTGIFERLQSDLNKLYKAAADARDGLRAVQMAGVALASDLSVDRLLQRVVDLSRGIIGARYAALSVFGTDGETQRFIYSPRDGAGQSEPVQAGSSVDVQVVYQGDAIGHLFLSGKEEGTQFDEADRDMAQLFAAHAAVAIANARLYSQVQELAVVEERQRIGMDLHDGTIQQLYAIGLMLESAMTMIDGGNGAEARSRLDRLTDQLNQTIANIRHYIFDLESDASVLDLPDAIAQVARQLGLASVTRVEERSQAWKHLSRAQNAALWHIAREVLANAARHAHARAVDVALGESAEGAVLVRFHDDGVGFDQSMEFSAAHRGLRNMALRSRQHRGDVRVRSSPGEGTSVDVTFRPEQDPSADEEAE